MAVVNLRLDPETLRVRSQETRLSWDDDAGKAENEHDRYEIEARLAEDARAFDPDDRDDLSAEVEAHLDSMGGIA